MVNHVRTLLLNAAAATGSTLWPAERYVPPDFRPRAVPAAARPVYDALFPPGCDRAFRNLRLAQLLPLLHQPRFGPLALAPDPRVTYLPFAADAFAAVRAAVSVSAVAGAAALTVQPSGQAPDPTRLLAAWLVEVVSAAEVRLSGPTGSTIRTYAATAGLSAAVPLPGTAYAVLFPPTAGLAWRVTVLTPPPPLAAATDAVDRLDTAALFDAYPEGRDAWASSPHATDRLAAAALAAARALDLATPGGGP